MKRNKSRLARIAYHEAGHAVADVRFGFGANGTHMIPDGRVLGAASPVYGPSAGDRDDHQNAAIAFLAGYAAEVVCCLGRSTLTTEAGAQSDMDRALGLLDLLGEADRFDEWLSCAFGFAAGDELAIGRVATELLRRRKLEPDEVEILVDIADGEATEADLAQFRRSFSVAADTT